MLFSDIKNRVKGLDIRHGMAEKAVADESEALAKAEADLTALRESTAIAQEITTALQAQAHNAIAATVSRCLASVFDEPYEFRILFEAKRGRTEARLVFFRNEQEIDPMTAAGGGVVDVAAFALRLACLFLQKPAVRKVLILDEPFRFVPAEFLPRVRALIETLSVEMGVQIIMVTHIEELKIGEVVEL